MQDPDRRGGTGVRTPFCAPLKEVRGSGGLPSSSVAAGASHRRCRAGGHPGYRGSFRPEAAMLLVEDGNAVDLAMTGMAAAEVDWPRGHRDPPHAADPTPGASCPASGGRRTRSRHRVAQGQALWRLPSPSRPDDPKHLALIYDHVSRSFRVRLSGHFGGQLPGHPGFGALQRDLRPRHRSVAPVD